MKLHLGDCIEVMRGMDPNSVDTIVCDPPYGLEFMGRSWDGADGFRRSLNQADVGRDNVFGRTSRTSPEYNTGLRSDWQDATGFTKPGIGERKTAWPSFTTGPHGNANPTCAKCGGRARGKKKCSCETPEWKPIGKRRNPQNENLSPDATSGGTLAQMSLFQQWTTAWAKEALRVAKPGSFMLVFGGTRTFHRMACGIEDAGWVIRDSIACWVYGSGFPKSLDISKAIDKEAGAEREVVGTARGKGGENLNQLSRPNGSDDDSAHGCGAYGIGAKQMDIDIPITAPATDAAKAWDGWGTSLKPAWEPVIVAMKPMDGTFARNATKWGVAGLNIEGCRIGTNDNLNGGAYAKTGVERDDGWGMQRAGAGEFTQPQGRWPANLVLSHHPECVEVGQRTIRGDQRGDCDGKRPGGFANIGADNGDGEPNARVYGDEVVPVYQCHPDCAVRLLDEQAGTRTGGMMKPGQKRVASQGKGGYQGSFPDEATASGTYWDTGGVSRFFYCAKASRKDRGEYNTHPTIKPHEIMRWLVRLTSTPTKGAVLDPFMGSGSTALACIAEGRHFIGIEREAVYFAIAERRIAEKQREAGLLAAA